MHAEKAKPSMTKFNDQDLTCTWHSLPLTASKEAAASVPIKEDQPALKNGEESTAHAAEDDADMM